MASNSGLYDVLLELESQLLTPEVRKSKAQLDVLLTDDFFGNRRFGACI